MTRVWRVLFGLWLLLASGAVAAQTLPAFSGPVVDAANVLPPDTEADLTAKLGRLKADTGRQLVVATIPDLQGYSIEDYGNKLIRGWGVGLKGVDNGAILLIAPKEHKVRIEVGYGLEPVLTDALSGIIIRNDMTPKLRAGDIPGATEAGTDALVTQLRLPDQEAKAKLDAAVKEWNAAHPSSSARHGGGGGIPIGMLFWGVILLFVVLPMLFGRRRQGWSGQRYGGGGGSNLPIILWGMAEALGESRRGSSGGGSGWSGGGSGGSDGGGWMSGGFDGGGGGSGGGGGASGDW